MSKGTDCEGGLVGHLLGHRFEPRYSVTFCDPDWVNRLTHAKTVYWAKDELRTYQGDVCRRCGMVVNEGRN